MKIRGGFVSNSSSTSFFFIFKENSMEHFYKLMREHKTHFELSCDGYWDETNTVKYINVEDVIKYIKNIEGVSSLDFGDKVGISPIDDLLNYYKDLRTSYEEWANRSIDNPSLYNIYWDDIMDCNHKLDRIESAKQRGFKYFFKVGFGDNDGEVSGGLVGTTMDYEGRNIFINNSRFIVMTEQNR